MDGKERSVMDELYSRIEPKARAEGERVSRDGRSRIMVSRTHFTLSLRLLGPGRVEFLQVLTLFVR